VVLLAEDSAATLVGRSVDLLGKIHALILAPVTQRGAGQETDLVAAAEAAVLLSGPEDDLESGKRRAASPGHQDFRITGTGLSGTAQVADP